MAQITEIDCLVAAVQADCGGRRQAYQYTESTITGKDSTSIISIVAGERIRAAYQLCQVIQEDLESTDVHFQAGQLIQLHAATKSLTDKLNDVVRELK